MKQIGYWKMENKNSWSVSYSQYSLWLTCPLAWKLKYIDNEYSEPSNIHNIFGSAMHRSVQDWLKENVYGGKTDAFIRHSDLGEQLKTFLVEEAKPHIKTEDGTYIFSREELEEFYYQGKLILRYLQINYDKIFPIENTELVGIEYKLDIPLKENLNFRGYIDVITKTDGEYKLFDLKTSTNGWSQYKKTDKKTTDQLILYKKFFADQENISMEDIDVEYVILKRKLPTDSPYNIPRVSPFSPSNGKPSVSKTLKTFNSFIDQAFDETGLPTAKNSHATPNKSSCRFCAFKEKCEFSYYKSNKSKANIYL